MVNSSSQQWTCAMHLHNYAFQINPWTRKRHKPKTNGIIQPKFEKAIDLKLTNYKNTIVFLDDILVATTGKKIKSPTSIKNCTR